MNIAFVVSCLSCGGAQRALVLLAQGFQKKGYGVAIITIDGKDTDFYSLPDGVQRLALNISGPSLTPLHALWNNAYRMWVLRRAISSVQPDVVISFMNTVNIVTSLALTGLKYPVLASEQCDPSMISCGFIWERLRRFTYPQIDRIVSASQGVDRYFDWLPKAKRAVINNPLAPIVLLPTREKLTSKQTSFSLIAMGRLTQQKGFDLLLQAFARLADRYSEWTLTILGEGELRTELESFRESLGLCDRVHLPGLVTNPYEVLLQADIFVLSSRFEGFGNVLIEAMACGVPVISTDCPSGPSEIIRDGVDGILVPNQDVDALTAAMARLMSDEKERKRLSAHAIEAVERFSLEKVLEMWDKLLAQVIEERV